MEVPFNSVPKPSQYLRSVKGPQKAVSVPEYERLSAVLDSVPGPSPWYIGHYLPLKISDGSKLNWRDIGNMYSGLVSAEPGSPVLLALGDYGYPMKLPGDKLLIWQSPEGQQTTQLTVIDPGLLRPLKKIRPRQPLIVDNNAIVAATSLPNGLSIGSHKVEFPEPLKGLHEIILLVNNPAREYFDEFVYSVRPSENSVDVHELEWFNKGGFDYYYQWITQLARDAQTGNIVGNGIRIPPFIMNGKCELEAWLYPSGDAHEDNEMPVSHE